MCASLETAFEAHAARYRAGGSTDDEAALAVAGLKPVVTLLPARFITYLTTRAQMHGEVRMANYFAEVRDLLEIGDVIYVAVTNAGALSTASWLVVKDKTASIIDTTDQTALTVTDTD